MNVEVAVLYTRVVNITSPPDGHRFPVGSSVTIAWTYDGPAELGNIFVDGTHIPGLDWTTGRSAVISGGYFSEARAYEIAVVGNWGTFDKINVIAYVVVEDTALSIEVSPPSPVEPAEGLAFTGYLTRLDTGVGVGGQTINLESPPGNIIATTTTFSAGNYVVVVNAPSSEGIYPYRTSFAGTAGLGNSVSRTLGLGVGAPIEPMLILASLVAGLLLTGVSYLLPTRWG